MLVRMWMSTDVVTAGPELPVGEALKLMAARKIRRLVILDKGSLVGVATISDLYKAQGQGGLPVGQFMTRNPATVPPEAAIETAGVLMRDRKIGAVPVIENGKLAGIITESDVFRALIEVLGLRSDGFRIAVEVEKDGERFYEMMEALAETSRVVLSCVIYTSYGKDKNLVVLRIEGSDAEGLARELWEKKFRVVQAKA